MTSLDSSPGTPLGRRRRRRRNQGSFAPPAKAVILKPCCMSQVLLATPLLAALSQAFPDAQFDWAVSHWARPAIATNTRLTHLIDSGTVGLAGGSWSHVRALVRRLRQEQYDTIFIPSRSSLLALVAWLAGIPQRVGLNVSGQGLAHTVAVRPPAETQHEAALYLLLARALGIEGDFATEFLPPDSQRTAVTRWLVDELEWLADVPLVLFHPGGGRNPVRPDETKRWPVERFALLGNHLSRRYRARILLVGDEGDCGLAEAVDGLMPTTVQNLAGRLSLAEQGALAEMADLYVGGDAGPTHVAAAVGCPTLAIFGPSDPAVSGPLGGRGEVVTLWRPPVVGAPFSWEHGVTAEEAIKAADHLLERRGRGRGAAAAGQAGRGQMAL